MNGGFFDNEKLHSERLDDCIAEEPAACDEHAAAAKQNSNDDTDDEGGVVLFGLFLRRGHGHFIHDDLSFRSCVDENGLE